MRIPSSRMLSPWPSKSSQTTLSLASHTEEAVRSANALHVKFSIVKRTLIECEVGDVDPEKDILTIHRLVQVVVHDVMENEQRLKWPQRIAASFYNQVASLD